MSMKIADRVLVYALFITLAVLSFVMIEGNRDARNAARDASKAADNAVVAANAARDASTNREQLNSHRLHNDAEHICLILAHGKAVIDPEGALASWLKCVAAKTEGTPDPEILE